MSEKSPAFQFYPRDFLTDTEGMEPEAIGAYWVLCSHSWFPKPDATGETPPVGYLPADENTIKNMSRLGTRWKKHRLAVLSRFKTDAAGRYYHKRIVEEWQKQQDKSVKAASAGHASQEVQAAKRAAVAEQAQQKRDQQNTSTRAAETSTDAQRTLNGRSTDAGADGERNDNSASASSSASAVEKAAAIPRACDGYGIGALQADWLRLRSGAPPGDGNQLLALLALVKPAATARGKTEAELVATLLPAAVELFDDMRTRGVHHGGFTAGTLANEPRDKPGLYFSQAMDLMDGKRMGPRQQLGVNGSGRRGLVGPSEPAAQVVAGSQLRAEPSAPAAPRRGSQL